MDDNTNDDDNVATSEDCTIFIPVVIGCTTNTNSTVLDLVVTYPTGELECGDILSVGQAGIEPTVSIIRTEDSDADTSVMMDDDGSYYTLLLVDTTADSDMHPILHFGASNIPSADIYDLVLADVDPFSPYRGPAPPSFLTTQVYNYEWILAKQDVGFLDALPNVGGTINFDYESYLDGVGGTVLITKYFSSGNCVRDLSSAATATVSFSLVLGFLGMNLLLALVL